MVHRRIIPNKPTKENGGIKEPTIRDSLKKALELLRAGGNDEVNARVWCAVKKAEFIGFQEYRYMSGDARNESMRLVYRIDGKIEMLGEYGHKMFPSYTTSIDAQAGLLPDGWKISVQQYTEDHWYASVCKNMNILSHVTSTEPRARLDAILQALIEEWEQQPCK